MLSIKPCEFFLELVQAGETVWSKFAGLYRGQLDRMEANGFDVFTASCRLSTPAKLAVVARGMWR